MHLRHVGELYVEGEEKWVPPMDRVIWGRSQVMTFEFDQPDLDFFRQQLRWCRSSTGKLLDCQMGALYHACSQWIDFEGITVCYSANKSFHIHIVFETGHARSMGIEQHIRHGLNLHWHKLLETVMQNLQPGEYYAEVDGKPDTVPKKKIKVSTGGFSFKTGAGAGKYYLHIANRDPRSRVLSSVGHYLFFASPFDVEEDQMLAESYRRIEEIKRIRRKIDAAKGDPAATQLWINRLQEIEAQLK